MARKAAGVRKITDFLQASSSSVASVSAREETGVPPAPKKSKHRDSYDPKWRDLFPWVRFVDDEDEGPSMFCSLCQKYNKTTSKMVWISLPCKQFRKDKLRDHERSKCHIEAVRSDAFAATSKKTGGIQAALEDQVSVQRQAVKGALKCMYWLAKEETAHHTKFSSLLQLGEFLGCSYLSELAVAKNATYTSHRTIDEFMTILSDCLEMEMLSKIRASPSIGILCDESTDVSNLKQLVVFVQYLVGRKVHSAFLKMDDLFDGKADTIERKLLEICETCAIPMSKVFGFGSDGASVITGRHSGVAARMKVHNPEMVSVHCGAHRVALASSQAALQVPYMKVFDSHLTTIYYHFANSAVREAALHQIQEVMGNPELRLKKAVHTRWLSHDQVITAIRRTLPSLIVALEREVAENSDAVARGLVHAIKSHKFVSTVYLLSDILPHLTTLSLVFQMATVDLSMIQPQVAATVASLKFLRDKPGPHLRKLEECLQSLASQFGLVTSDSLKQSFQKNIREKYIDQVVENLENLENRFQDVGLLSAFNTLFDSTSAVKASKKTSDSQFVTYGDSAVADLATHFETSVTQDSLESEWMSFKHILSSKLQDDSPSEVMATLSSDTSLSSLYPNLSKIASIALTIPVSTASCERGFSTMKRIKTAPRNRLKTDTLDKLIRLSSEGPPLEEFDYTSAIDLWASKHNRRLIV